MEILSDIIEAVHTSCPSFGLLTFTWNFSRTPISETPPSDARIGTGSASLFWLERNVVITPANCWYLDWVLDNILEDENAITIDVDQEKLELNNQGPPSASQTLC